MSAGGKYELRIKRSAEKELNALPVKTAKSIVALIRKLASNPRPRGSKRLRATDAFRIRQGDYRILYTVDDPNRLIEIVAIGHRREVYRGL